MPIYDFHCPKCDTVTELMVRYSDTPACPSCGSMKMDRLVSAIAPAGKSAEIRKSWRARAAREGHTCNFAG